jgi:hypothetical protein
MMHMVQMMIWILSCTVEKDLQRRLSNAKKQTNVTDFFTLKKMCNVCLRMCQMYMYMYNKTGNLSKLGGINLNIILNVI